MAVRLPDDHWGTRSISCYEKVEQIGEGTYGQVISLSIFNKRVLNVSDLRLVGHPFVLSCSLFFLCFLLQ